MIIRYAIIVIVLLSVSVTNEAFALFTKTPPEGFLWYNENLPKKAETQQKETAKQRDNLEHPPINDWGQRLENLKQRLEQAEKKALDNPTLANVLQAQRLQKLVVDKAEKFATMWQLAALIDAKLINFEEHSNSLHQKLQEQKNAKQDDDRLKNIAQSWGMVLQFDAGCPICHTFAPIIKELAEKYGFQILAVSKTGEDFLDMPGGIDTGFLVNSGLNPEKLVPVLYLMSSDGRMIYPIARGLTEQSKIIENIMLLSQNHQRLTK